MSAFRPPANRFASYVDGDMALAAIHTLKKTKTTEAILAQVLAESRDASSSLLATVYGTDFTDHVHLDGILFAKTTLNDDWRGQHDVACTIRSVLDTVTFPPLLTVRPRDSDGVDNVLGNRGCCISFGAA